MIQDLGFLLIGMAGGSDDERLAVLGTQVSTGSGGMMQAEINDRITTCNVIGQRIAFVDTCDHFQSVHFLATSDEHLAHPTLRTVNDYLGHVT